MDKKTAPEPPTPEQITKWKQWVGAVPTTATKAELAAIAAAANATQRAGLPLAETADGLDTEEIQKALAERRRAQAGMKATRRRSSEEMRARRLYLDSVTSNILRDLAMANAHDQRRRPDGQTRGATPALESQSKQPPTPPLQTPEDARHSRLAARAYVAADGKVRLRHAPRIDAQPRIATPLENYRVRNPILAGTVELDWPTRHSSISIEHRSARQTPDAPDHIHATPAMLTPWTTPSEFLRRVSARLRSPSNETPFAASGGCRLTPRSLQAARKANPLPIDNDEPKADVFLMPCPQWIPHVRTLWQYLRGGRTART